MYVNFVCDASNGLMSKLVFTVDSLENKVSKLLHRLELLQQANAKLEAELEAIRNGNARAELRALEWEEKYNSLKVANSMLGGNSNKTEAKFKINTLIRELDHCIAQLAE